MNQPHWKGDDDMGEIVRFPEHPTNGPVTGELVDADGDGLPDTTHVDRGGLVERPAAVVGPVFDGELLGEADEKALAWRRTMETRPVVPAWIAEREQRVEAIRWATRYTWHRIKFHAVRVPVYGLRLVFRAPIGGFRFLGWWGRWVFDQEGAPLRQAAVQVGMDGYAAYLQLSQQRNTRLKLRGIGSAVAALATAGGVFAMDAVWPAGWWLLAPSVVAALGVWGGRADRPLIAAATLAQEATKLLPDVVVRAFTAAGLAKEADPITFPQPIQRDGKGWLAVVDLPYGRHYGQAAQKREALASGLNANAVTVFMDPDAVSARRVRLWVSDIDVFAQKPVPSPLLKMEKFDFWQPIPFGVDARDRRVDLPLIWSSLLVGAIPRMGKTFAARLTAAAAALDPWVRMYVFNGKGDASWKPFEKVAHVYGSGIRDEVVERLVQSLEDLQADMNSRNERMEKLPADARPEDKLTPALSRNRSLNMPLTVMWIDEVQRYLEHPVHGKDILALLTDLAKVAPSAGIMLVLATQKPDSKVIPDSLRGQLGSRFAMKVMTWQASETILGAGTYSAGMDASTLLRSHKGVGILLGADDGELAERGGQIVRTHLLDGPGVESICVRGRALREENRTLTGMASGAVPVEARPTRVLDDLARVFQPGEDKVPSKEAVERLAELNPGAYDGWSENQLATALKPYDLSPGQVWVKGDDGKGANRRGYVRDAVTEALAARLDKGR